MHCRTDPRLNVWDKEAKQLLGKLLSLMRRNKTKTYSGVKLLCWGRSGK
jgi:hypothetical protein